MKIVCVSGGSYKSFYLNYYVNLKSCDLLIFNYGIIYDIDFSNINYQVVINELLSLAQNLHTAVVAGVNVIEKGEKIRALIVTNGKDISISSLNIGAKICFDKSSFAETYKFASFVFGNNFTHFGDNHKIIFDSKAVSNLSHCSKNKIYLFINNHGVDFVKNRKLIKFNYKVNTIKFWFIYLCHILKNFA